MKEQISLQVNGQSRTVEVDPTTPLLYVLRNQLALNGPKYGCGLEQCGACMVLVDGQARPSCRLPVSAVTEASITTLEGLTGADGELHPVQEAFVQEQAAQCGYCLNGMVMSAVALLDEHSDPDRDAINEGMRLNLCRCGTHTRFIRAVKAAAEKANATKESD